MIPLSFEFREMSPVLSITQRQQHQQATQIKFFSTHKIAIKTLLFSTCSTQPKFVFFLPQNIGISSQPQENKVLASPLGHQPITYA
jgi:hypothetical protein